MYTGFRKISGNEDGGTSYRQRTSPPWRRCLLASPAASNFLERDVLSVLERGDYDDSFALALACKDLGLAVDLARQTGVPAEVSALVEQIYRRARAQYGDHGGEMLPIKLLEDLTSTRLRLPEE